MKRPTVNPESFKKKFQDNNYNNNEEALLDFDDGVSIAMIKEFHESSFFPTQSELNTCIENTGSHNKILLKKFKSWISDGKKDNVLFSYHSQTINELMPITRWYKESIRHGNGMAIEGVWMLCPPLYCQVGKTNYRDEAFVQIVNAIAKWPRAYKLMYRQNRTVNVSGKQGHQLAGDEWVEDFLVRPVKQFISAQSSFSMVELMSCSANILELNKEMYKSSAAFDVHQTKTHQKPSSLYDQTKVAQFALKEEWFKKTSSIAKKYPWGGKSVKPQEPIPKKCLNVFKQGDEKARKEFKGFLNRKFPNDMI